LNMRLSLATLAATLPSLSSGGLVTKALASTNPVTRVVELLEALSKKVEAELKSEEDLYESFECWAKSVVSQKTASNAAALARSNSLETYIQDLDAGRIELTTERVDLEKEIAGLTSSIEEAEALRAKELADFEAASGEMSQAITALEEAISVLESGTSTGATLLRVKTSTSDTIASRVADGKAVSLVLRLSQGSLTKADHTFLERVLTAEVPVKDWKKLNRKATFKDKYEARSGEIVKTLKSLLQTFQSNLKEATDKEEKAATVHSTLMTSKGGQKTKAQEALQAMEVEGAARGLSRSEASAEVEALKAQMEADTKYISDTNTALDTKKSEWAERKQLRTDEIAAISKAISILRSDDARDLLKRSLSSQGYSLLQAKTRNVATAKLVTISKVQSAASPFEKVITSIDSMIAILEKEEGTDLSKKEGCESARAEDTREAATISRSMDDLTDSITKLVSEIGELKVSIDEKNTEIVAIKEDLEKAKRIREDEHAEWVKTDADDRDAAELVGQAVAVLEKFYGGLALTQQKKGSKQPVEGMAAGEAPPPPPSTWETPYGGAQEENTGIVTILQMIQQDIEKDRTAATASETAAATAYGTFKTEGEQQITALEADISTLEGQISEKEMSVQGTTEDRLSAKAELDAVIAKIRESAPGCNFFTINYETRLKNRQTELDGLKKAKQVLQGASFTSA